MRIGLSFKITRFQTPVRYAVPPSGGGGLKSPPLLVSGWSCVERSAVSMRNVVCAHFVSDIFLQILAYFSAELGGSWQNFCITLIGGWGPLFATFGLGLKACTSIENWNESEEKGSKLEPKE